MAKELYEVYKQGGFVAVARPGTLANNRLRAAGMFPVTDMMLEKSGYVGESLTDQAKKKLAEEGRQGEWKTQRRIE